MIKAINSVLKPKKFDPCPKCGGMPEFEYDRSQATFCIWVQCTQCGLRGINDDSHGGARSYWESKQYEKQTTNFVQQTIKPIETRYKGYRFRSRLEARWAVFFDAVGISWEYEAEGFDLGFVAGYYLPDFWFPDLNIFGEVKPNDFSDIERVKCIALQNDTGRPVILLQGTPTPKLYFDVYGNAYGLFPYKGYIWSSQKLHIGHSDIPFLLWPDKTKLFEEFDITGQDCLINACNAARSARFEHGENPKI